MKVLVAEYITGGGMCGVDLPESLAREGKLMRRALLDDLLQADGASELLVLNDARFAEEASDSRLQWLTVDNADGFEARWRVGLQCCDAVWLIAPESDDILAELSAEVVTAGRALLSNPADAVRLAASKSVTTARLRAHGLPVVECWSLVDYQASSKAGGVSWDSPLVLKPDDGVGCEGARIVFGPSEIDEVANSALIVQPLLEGESLSLSVLFARGDARLLTVNRQMIERRGDGFALTGCQVNAVHDVDGRWQALASDIARAVPELWGYAGVDLILTDEGPRILEINPRLTTSYTGIREATGINTAALVLDLSRGAPLPPFRQTRGVTVEVALEPIHAH